MTPHSALRFLLAALLGGFALLLGWTAFPVMEKGTSWRPFFVVSGAAVVLALTLGWLVARA
ncbi:hypothetical protein QOL99_11910 [Deinococcus sp. MIMF12]|uniref:Uncharacterized protein n=1 Tax=Deinococcus rhizophilus TaxID=3049544 RepID=A0ABT7JJT3_9DEIO|nr:hypothetical protein [Deinococcus rhizophilus]MDL2344852.1 hypothetical protein [Deinococcus rhizophilus]